MDAPVQMQILILPFIVALKGHDHVALKGHAHVALKGHDHAGS